MLRTQADLKAGTKGNTVRSNHLGSGAQGGAEDLTPTQFIFVSSPMEKKICWAELKNMKSTKGRVFPLIDSGLGSPNGIALDRNNGLLYVADFATREIYRYDLGIEHTTNSDGTLSYNVVSQGVRLTVVEGKRVRWLAVGPRGDLFFADEDTNSVNRLPFPSIQMIASGELLPGNIETVTEKNEEAIAAAAAAQAEQNPSTNLQQITDKDAYETGKIFSLYEASASPHVTTPSGIYTDGTFVYWGNAGNGVAKGSLVEGEVIPEAPLTLSTSGGAAAFPTTVLSSNTNTVQGVTKTRSSVVYSDDQNKVYAVGLSGGQVYTLTDSLDSPRGLVWDGDNTVYVADGQAGKIWSIPSGRLASNLPVSSVVEFRDAFGLALLTANDPFFEKEMNSNAACARGVKTALFAVVVALATAAAGAAGPSS